MASFRLVTIKGRPHDRGVAYGRAAADLIQHFLHEGLKQLAQARSSLSFAEAFGSSAPYVAHIERHAPHLAEEVEGIARGAEISRQEAFLLQLRAELAHAQLQHAPTGCTSIGVSPQASGGDGVLLGQNVDMEPFLGRYGIILHVIPHEGPPIVCWTLAGVVGQTGVNGAGLGRCGNAVTGPSSQVGVPTSVLFRLALECTTVEQVLELCRTVPRAKANTFVLGDATGRVGVLEMTADDQRFIEAADGSVVHTNHYCHPDLAALDRGRHRENSLIRLSRIEDLRDRAQGTIRVADIMRHLSDHENTPHSICGHGTRGLNTIASCVLAPGQGRLYVSNGNPCATPYEEYTVTPS